MCRCVNMQMCRYFKCADEQMCEFNYNQLLSSAYLHILAFAHQFIINKKSPLVNTRRLLYFHQGQLLTFVGIDRVLNVIVMHNYFFK